MPFNNPGEGAFLTLSPINTFPQDSIETIIQSYGDAGVNQQDIRNIINVFESQQNTFIERFTENFITYYRELKDLVEAGSWLKAAASKAEKRGGFLRDTTTISLASKITNTLVGGGSDFSKIFLLATCLYQYNALLAEEQRQASEQEIARKITQSFDHIKNTNNYSDNRDNRDDIEAKVKRLATILYVRFQLPISFIYSSEDVDHFSKFFVSLISIYCEKHSSTIINQHLDVRRFVENLLTVTELESFSKNKNYNALLSEFKNKKIEINQSIIVILKKSSTIKGNTFCRFLDYSPRNHLSWRPTWKAWEIACHSPVYVCGDLSSFDQQERPRYYLRQESEKQRSDKYPPQILSSSNGNIPGYVVSETEVISYLDEIEVFDSIRALLLPESRKLPQHNQNNVSFSLQSIFCGNPTNFYKKKFVLGTLLSIVVLVIILPIIYSRSRKHQAANDDVIFFPTSTPSSYPTTQQTLQPMSSFPVNSSDDSLSSDFGSGDIAGIIIGILLFISILSFSAYYFLIMPTVNAGMLSSDTNENNLKTVYTDWRARQKSFTQIAWGRDTMFKTEDGAQKNNTSFQLGCSKNTS